MTYQGSVLSCPLAFVLCVLLLSLSIINSVLGIPNTYTAPLTPSNMTFISNHTKSITNRLPIVKVVPHQTVDENTIVRLTGSAYEPGQPNNKLTYLWKQISGPNTKLKNSNTTNPSFMAPTVQSDKVLRFSLTAKDDNGGSSNNSAIVAIIVKHVNHSPVANGGQKNQLVNPRDIVTLDASKSKDLDNDPLTYAWKQTGGPPVVLNNANTSIATFTAPSNISANTVLAFRLTVKDSKNTTGIDDTTVIDKYTPPANQAPIANAGADQIVNAGDKVILDATSSKDLDGIITSYFWNYIGGGPSVKLNGASTPRPSFKAPLDISSSNSNVLVFELAVTDDKGARDISTVKITVNPINHPPLADAGANQTVSPGYVVTLDASKSKDLDNDPLTYAWKQTGGPPVVLNNANTSIATFTAPSNISANTVLAFRLTVKDSKNTTGIDDTTVIDKYTPPANQAPIANAGADQIVNAGDKVILDATSSKDLDGIITSYFWNYIGGGPSVKLNGASTPRPSFKAPLDISSSNSNVLVFELAVTDDKGARDISTVKITVNPINHPPLADAGANQTVSPGYVVTLDASKSKDLDNDPLTYAWKQTGGPPVVLNNANTSIATFTAPSNISANTGTSI